MSFGFGCQPHQQDKPASSVLMLSYRRMKVKAKPPTLLLVMIKMQTFASLFYRYLRQQDPADGLVDALFLDPAVLHGFQQAVEYVLLVLVFVADQQEVGASFHRADAKLLEGEDVRRAHFQVVGGDDAAPAEIVSQQVGHDGGGEAGGEVFVNGCVDDMGNHDEKLRRVALREHRAERDEVFFFQGFHVRVDDDGAQMGVRLAFAEAGKMLERAERAFLRVARDGFADEGGYGFRVVRVAAGTVAHVGHRREVQVDAEAAKALGGFFRPCPRRGGVAAFADLRLGGRRREDVPHARHGAAFLVDGDEERELAVPRFLQFLREAAHAFRRFEVAVVEDDAAYGVFREHEAAVVVQLRAVDADHHQLPDFFRKRHVREDGVRPFLRRHHGHDPRRSRLRRPAAAPQYNERRQQQRKKQPDPFLSHIQSPNLSGKAFILISDQNFK